MSSPPLLKNASAVPEYYQLTPRTPHTSQVLSQGEANEIALDEDPRTFQSAPLLPSSSTEERSFVGVNTRRKKTYGSAKSLWTVASVAPLVVGIVVGSILLFLLVLSVTKPGSLHRYLGINPALSSPGSTFVPPLHPIEYLKMCATGHHHHGDYWDIDNSDHAINTMGAPHTDTDERSIICDRTVTYMLDGSVGLTADLALLAQAASLAHEQNRTFLVDDTYWNRGRWRNHFEDVRLLQPGPQPGCNPPPGNELVACPRTARHWVITSRTAKFHFGDEFSNHYEDPYAHALNRLKPIFSFTWNSFKSTIIPNDATRALIKLARESFSSFLHDDDHRIDSNLNFVSTHIRRGDRKTLAYSFPDRKVPLPNYVDAIKSVWSRLYHPNSLWLPVIYLATDSPEVHGKFAELYEGTVFSLFTAPDPRLRALASPGEYYQNRFDELDLQTQITATKGMIVDLAVLTGLWQEGAELMPDAVVCALSSNVCRLAPVGMGWEVAFGHVDASGDIDEQHHRWVDVDQQGLIIPVWEAFELF